MGEAGRMVRLVVRLAAMAEVRVQRRVRVRVCMGIWGQMRDLR